MSENNKGVPIYRDPVRRTLVDTASESYDPNEWHPMNGPANKLLKCHEALQDILENLETYLATDSVKKRRRRLRSMFVPLHSLCVALVDLINQIQSDHQMHDRLPANATKNLTLLRSRFVELVPFSRDGKLGKLRNKISAHYEKTMTPGDMRNLYQETDSTEVGEWLHLGLSTLCDLLKLDAYMWTASGPEPDTSIIMCQEPLMSCIRVKDSQITGIEGFFMQSESPRDHVFSLVIEIAEVSQPLFQRHCKFRINRFKKDSEGASWAQTLENTHGKKMENIIPDPQGES